MLAALNPLTWVKQGLEKGLDALSPKTEASLPATRSEGNTPDDRTIYADGDPVSGHFVDDQPTDHTALAAKRTRDFGRIVSSFDEDKQHLLAAAVSKFFTALAY